MAGLLAACSGSNGLISLGDDVGDDADDASAGAEASAADEGGHASGSGDSMHTHGDDAGGGDATTEDDASKDAAAPGDATLTDGTAPTDAEVLDAARDAEARDAGPDATGPVDAAPDAEGKDAARDAGREPDATLPDAATPETDASPEGAAPEPDASPDASPEAGAPDASGDDAGSSSPDARDDAAEPDTGVDGPSCPLPSLATGSFVDGAQGADDSTHGGGPGACAYRTITYALANAPRRIAVASGTYSAATGETLPFVLTGRQGIFCTNATLAGQARFQGTEATAVLDGTENVLSDCTLVGNDRSGACVIVASDGNRAGHDLEALDVSRCGDVGVAIEGTNVRVADGFFHDSDRGVAWGATDPTGELMDNTFANDPLDDIECTAGDGNVTGTGNLDGADVATCDGCNMCPFP
ncbi:MAG TPA: DUF1565 domain-containing protein [Polyangiaceae bacterium]|jgi:hypothetical protein|nr:DUF1565 domain-containing protein [Polyangiaceae bacterium]